MRKGRQRGARAAEDEVPIALRIAFTSRSPRSTAPSRWAMLSPMPRARRDLSSGRGPPTPPPRGLSRPTMRWISGPRPARWKRVPTRRPLCRGLQQAPLPARGRAPSSRLDRRRFHPRAGPSVGSPGDARANRRGSRTVVGLGLGKPRLVDRHPSSSSPIANAVTARASRCGSTNSRTDLSSASSLASSYAPSG